MFLSRVELDLDCLYFFDHFYENGVMLLHQLSEKIKYFLHSPYKVFMICLGVLMFTFILKGHMWRLWSLHHEIGQMAQDIKSIELSINKLSSKVRQAKDPNYLEKQAKDRMDYVEEGDLVFVFPD